MSDVRIESIRLKRSQHLAGLAILLMATLTFPLLAQAKPGKATPKQRGSEALEYAFRFASAIQNDDTDRGKAQEAAILEMAQAGDLDGAIERAESVTSWRRGTVMADLASMLAEQGRRKEAETLLKRADEFRTTAEGWKERRIAAHVSHAHASLGDVDTTERMAKELVASDGRQYAGRAVASVAAGKAALGDFAGAMDALSKLDEALDFDATWWRTVGYSNLARKDNLSRAQRLQALDKAYVSVDGISGWKRAEALQSLAKVYIEFGKTDKARAAMHRSHEMILSMDDQLPIKAPLLSNMARSWAEVKENKKARELLAQAEKLVPSNMVIEQPAIYANIATGYAKLGDTNESRRVYDRALISAKELVNARPRALAAVEICRQMGRLGYELDASTRSRLDDLLYGLKAPW